MSDIESNSVDEGSTPSAIIEVPPPAPPVHVRIGGQPGVRVQQGGLQERVKVDGNLHPLDATSVRVSREKFAELAAILNTADVGEASDLADQVAALFAAELVER